VKRCIKGGHALILDILNSNIFYNLEVGVINHYYLYPRFFKKILFILGLQG
jgi:hypothetical protein